MTLSQEITLIGKKVDDSTNNVRLSGTTQGRGWDLKPVGAHL